MELITMAHYKRIGSAVVGNHRGCPRIYLQGKYLLKAGFIPESHYQIEFDTTRITIQKTDAGRKVSSKCHGEVPVIDINSRDLRNAVRESTEIQIVTTAGKITITPARTAYKCQTRCRNGKEGSLFSGGGLLTQAAKGYEPAFAVEVDGRYAETYEANHPTAVMFNMSISEVSVEELPEVELITMGIPCKPFSNARHRDRSTVPEDHELGDLVFWALKIIDHLNPASIVIEEVPGFMHSGAGFILMNALRRMGYNLWHETLDAADYGQLTGRKRAVIVAHTDGYEAPIPSTTEQCLGDLLEDDDGWFTKETKPWLFNHWKRQTAKGYGFAPSGNRLCTEQSTRVGTIKRRYFAQQGDNPVVCHPTEPGKCRWLTVTEVKRLHGVPDDYQLPKAKTVAGEILGQGVSVGLFEQVIAGIQ